MIGGDVVNNREPCIVLIDIEPGADELYSHMQICSDILKECLKGYNIKIIDLTIKKSQGKKADIQQLVLALKQCLKIKPLFISLSMGSIRLSDTYYLQPLIKRLASKHIHVVAAYSNSGYLTLPAYFPEVIGVIADQRIPVKKPYVYRVEKNNWGVDLVAECKDMDDAVAEMYATTNGNSLAVPVAVSALYQSSIGRVMSKEKLLEHLSVKKVTWFQKMTERNFSDLQETPWVVINDDNTNIAELERGFTYMSTKYQVEAALYTREPLEGHPHILSEAIAALDIVLTDYLPPSENEPDIVIQRLKDETIYSYDEIKVSYPGRQSIEKVFDETLNIIETYGN